MSDKFKINMPKFNFPDPTPRLDVERFREESRRSIKQETALHTSVKAQEEILKLLKSQSESSKRESYKNTAILVLTTLSVIIAATSLILTLIL